MGYLAKHLSLQADRPQANKLWGHEELVHNDHHYCGKLLHYDGKAASSLHRHLVKDEVLMVVKGVVLLEVQEPGSELETAILSELNLAAIHLEPGVWHRLTPYGEALIFEWSTSHNDEDVERREPSYLLPC